MVVMIAFCSQGDNIQDAVAMAARVDKWLHVNKKEVSSKPYKFKQQFIFLFALGKEWI